jgi:hypothetical protein
MPDIDTIDADFDEVARKMVAPAPPLPNIGNDLRGKNSLAPACATTQLARVMMRAGLDTVLSLLGPKQRLILTGVPTRSPLIGRLRVHPRRRITILFIALFAPLCLVACATTQPAVRVEIQTVRVPVATLCVRASDIPAKPALLGSQLTGNPVHDLDMITAQLLRFMTYGEVQAALLSGCVAP